MAEVLEKEPGPHKIEIKTDTKGQQKSKHDIAKMTKVISNHIMNIIGKPENFHEANVIPLWETEGSFRCRVNVYTCDPYHFIDRFSIWKSYFVHYDVEKHEVETILPNPSK